MLESKTREVAVVLTYTGALLCIRHQFKISKTGILGYREYKIKACCCSTALFCAAAYHCKTNSAGTDGSLSKGISYAVRQHGVMGSLTMRWQIVSDKGTLRPNPPDRLETWKPLGSHQPERIWWFQLDQYCLITAAHTENNYSSHINLS